jgi:hypothetical protein
MTGRNVTVAANEKPFPAWTSAPKTTRPPLAPSTLATMSHPAIEARTAVGKSSLARAPSAGASSAPARTPRT